MKTLWLAAMIGFLATGAMAHSPLENTTPGNAEQVAEVPSEILLTFKGSIRLTRVTMSHADHHGIDLDLSGHKGFISDYAIPLQSMGSGPYVIEWRGLGMDGHALTGAFNFDVE